MARSAFQVLVIPYRDRAEGLEVAVFRRVDYALWQFVSGGGEDGETPYAAAVREVGEEAGVFDRPLLSLDSMTMIPACWFSAWPSWPADVLLVPEHAFAVDVGDAAVTLSAEHSEFAWLRIEAAMETLRFDSNKNALWELHERVHPRPRGKRPAYR